MEKASMRFIGTNNFTIKRRIKNSTATPTIENGKVPSR